MGGARRDTPAMRQYDAFKTRHPDCVLFFRMGDFYEMFDEDAVLCHRVLGITLTQRSEGIPMAGVPYHSVETYLRRMIDQGYRVAVCDQVQDPREVKGSAVIERAVTRVLTPGTLVDESLLRDDVPNHLAAVVFEGHGEDPKARVGVAIVELSTGAFTLADCAAGELVDELSRRHVSEVMYCPTADGKAPARAQRVLDLLRVPGTARPSWHFRRAEAVEALTKHFGVASLQGFGLSDEDPAIPAAGVVLRYLLETQSMDTAHLATSEGASSGSAHAMRVRARSLGHLRPPRREPADDGRLLIDATGLRALEVEQTIRAGAGPGAGGIGGDGSLLGLFSRGSGADGGGRTRGCVTAMGRRLLRDRLCRPSNRIETIRARLELVESLVRDVPARAALDAALDGVQDVPRIAARIGLGRATPRDVTAMARSIAKARAVESALAAIDSAAGLRGRVSPLVAALERAASEVTRVCVDAPPSHLREGGMVRDGVDAVVDECRVLQKDSGAWLGEYQARLNAEHDLPGLKVGFNKVFGYYIELPSAQARRAPAAFSRRQTLKNAERFITPELKAYEDKVLGASDRMVQREGEMFFALCTLLNGVAREAGAFADVCAELDVAVCFADKASQRGWVRPEMVEEPVLEVVQGRHPVLEAILGEGFVPNDLALGDVAAGDDASIAGRIGEPARTNLGLITGPNMGGKSTYIRQAALIVLLAHAGSFVPAASVKVGVTDRLFTRIGADDALHAGQSTFMVEMVETARILHHATARSLVVLDEIGRGTSTLDGLSLAWAIAEHLSSDGGPRTLFATHYHELTELEERSGGRVVNLHVLVKEWQGEVVFVHRIVPGRANRSYGVHVARLAGLPAGVVERASVLLESLSVSHAGGGRAAEDADRRTREKRADSQQLGLFTAFVAHPAVDALRDANLEAMSPLQAFDALRELKKMVDAPARA